MESNALVLSLADRLAICSRLLSRCAERRGGFLAVVPPCLLVGRDVRGVALDVLRVDHDTTIGELSDWLDSAENRGLEVEQVARTEVCCEW